MTNSQTLCPEHKFFAKDFEHHDEPAGPSDSELDDFLKGLP